MKIGTIGLAAVLGGLLFSGCTTGGIHKAGGSSKWVGKEIVFKTAERAPAQFDAWTFYWIAPKIQAFDGTLDYVVLLPDNKEHYAYRDLMVDPGGTARSDFGEGMPGGDVAPLQGQHIRVMFRVNPGKFKFNSNPGNYSFGFYKRGADGKINWGMPFMTIPAVVE